MKIGIGITSRLRVDVLELCLEYYAKYLPKQEFKFVVCHDHDDQDYSEMIAKYPFVEYSKSETRLGIAKNKNECLKKLKDCDYIFLMDDDVMPVREDWVDFFVNHSIRTGINHFLYQIDLPFLSKANERDGIAEYHNCGGILLFITKEVIAKIGGFDSRFEHPYGYEHANYSMRIYNAGLQNGYGRYVSPVGVNEVMFSLDYDMNNLGLRPPFHPDLIRDMFTSSIAGEEHLLNGWINGNSRYLNPTRTYEEI